VIQLFVREKINQLCPVDIRFLFEFFDADTVSEWVQFQQETGDIQRTKIAFHDMDVEEILIMPTRHLIFIYIKTDQPLRRKV